MENRKASTRAKVEHPLDLYDERLMAYEGRYRGLAKNNSRLMLLLGMTELDNDRGILGIG